MHTKANLPSHKCGVLARRGCGGHGGEGGVYIRSKEDLTDGGQS